MSAGSRRLYLDWLRGVAVLIMIEAHLLDAWSATAARDDRIFALAILLGGIGAPLFLFLAGISVSLSVSAKIGRGIPARQAAYAVVKRGLEVFALAFLFRAQACLLGWSSPWDLLKVDILNIMGLAILAAGALSAVGGSLRRRALLFGGVTAAIAFATPLVRAAPIAALPDPIEAYIRPVDNLANFVIFPSAGFLFAGALTGVVLVSAAAEREGRTLRLVGVAGVAVAIAAYGLSYLPSPYPSSRFWSTSPAYFFLQAGILATSVAAAYLWGIRPGGAQRRSPMRQLGRTSLFIYWIHVEMLYGLISLPLHKSLSTGGAFLAFLLFASFMLLCSIAKEKAVEKWRRGAAAVTPAGGSPAAPGRL